MGGAGYIFTGEHDSEVMHNSAMINLNMVDICYRARVKKVFYSSSACIYPAYNQTDPNNPKCSEDSAYPAAPDSEYRWEKLFSERIYLAYHRNNGLAVRIARFHNIFGPEGAWNNDREKAPVALCRKVAEAEDGGEIEIWGDGKGVPMRREGQPSKSVRLKKGEKANRKRQACVGAVYTIAPFVRRAEDVVNEVLREQRQTQRPQPQNKKLRAELTRPIKGQEVNGKDRIFCWFAEQIRSRNRNNRKPIRRRVRRGSCLVGEGQGPEQDSGCADRLYSGPVSCSGAALVGGVLFSSRRQ